MFKRQSALFAAAVLIVPVFFSILLFQTFAVGQGRFSSCPNDSPELSWDNCQGTKTFLNGSKYVGEFKDGKFNGQGTFASARENKYVGEWKDGKFNGQGTLTYAN